MHKFSKERKAAIIEQLPQLISEEYTSKQIADMLSISVTTVHRYCKKLELNIPNHHNSLKFDNTIFDTIDTEDKAYWLGFLYADGNVSSKSNSVTISLAKKDYDHLRKFNTFIKNNGKTYEGNCGNYEHTTISICNKHLKERLIELGCKPKKSLTLKFPDLSIFKDNDLVYAFIRGYVDGDGCLTFSRNGRLSIQILGTKEFLEGIQAVFPGYLNLYKVKRLKSNTWTLNNCGDKADYVATKLYKEAKIYLERKYNRFVVLCRNT